MTNEELIVMRAICGELIEARDKSNDYARKLAQAQGVNEKQNEEYSSLCLECNQLREREADALNANEDLKARCTDLMAERDEARRKLGALTLCVGFDASYDKWHPKKALLELQAEVKKCIEDNHIVLTEGGMAK